MILAAHVQRMFDVLENVLGHGLPGYAQIRHQVNSENTAFIGKFTELLVRLVPWMIRNRSATGMGNCNWLPRKFDRFKSGAPSTVTEVYQHAALVHSCDQIPSKQAKTSVARF